MHWVIPENIHTTPFGCPNILTIIRNRFFSPPLFVQQIASIGGVWIVSGTTHSVIKHEVAMCPNVPYFVIYPV